MKKSLFTTFSLFFGINSMAATELPLPDWKNLKLDSYLSSKESEQTIKELETSGDARRNFYVIQEADKNGAKVLKMQLFDFDKDGKIDLAKHFKNAKVVRTEWNLDKDEFAEVVKYHQAETGEVYLKVQTDGQGNVWTHYFKGEIRRQEFDRNNDKKPDMWYYFRAGKVYRAEVAKNFDPKKIEDITTEVQKRAN